MRFTRKKISKNSIFGGFKTWDILYIIIKTHDDLKQEQFAMQLIYQINYIFKLEKLPLILTPY
jgi:phosphatidylinositol 4-kinase